MGGPAATPSERRSQSALARRAARKGTMLARFPPLTMSPPAPRAGNPISSAIQRTVWASISVAAGERIEAPALGFTAAARRSPRAPIGAAEAVM